MLTTDDNFHVICCPILFIYLFSYCCHHRKLPSIAYFYYTVLQKSESACLEPATIKYELLASSRVQGVHELVRATRFDLVMVT